MLCKHLLILIALLGVKSSPLGNSSLVVHDVFTFPVNTSVENIAVRASGEILANVITAPELYQITPNKASLVHRFTGYQALLGITEVEKDQFYVVAGNFSVATIESTIGSYSIFHVDMSVFSAGHRAALVHKVTDIPEGQLLNGLGLFSREKGLIYVADSFGGIIYLLNVYTGTYFPAIHNALTTTAPADPSSPTLPGVNGVKAHDGVIYFTNSGQGILAKVPVFPNGTAKGEAQTVLSGFGFDDFTLDDEGRHAIAAVNLDNEVMRIDLSNGEFIVLAGSLNSTGLKAVTAAAFGRTNEDKHSVYVSTFGDLGQSAKVGGSVMRIDL